MERRETAREIDEAAADWVTRIDQSTLGSDEQAEFDAWLKGDVRRGGAFARARAILIYTKRAKALGPDFDPATFDLAAQPAGAIPIGDEPGGADSPTRRRVLIGGSLAVAASGAAALFLPLGQLAARTYQTNKGEIRVIPLADGSTVTLNSESRIAARVDGSRRSVELLAGEALFKVATARNRPFTVEAGDTSLRADSATFSICRLVSRPLQVQVCDGSVEIERTSFAASNRLVLQANMEATMSPDGSIVDRRVTADSLERDLAWQEGMLSFEDTPLSEAADEFARYSDRRIFVASRDVGAETVTGRYAANNPDGFAKAVALGLDLHVRSTADGILLAR